MDGGTFIGDKPCTAMAILFSGMQPTGELHLGNDLGALRQWVELTRSGQREAIFCVVDAHMATVDDGPQTFPRRVHDAARSCLTASIDPARSTVVVQSDVSLSRAPEPPTSRAGSVVRFVVCAVLFVTLALTVLALSGCSRRPPNASPDGAVRELVERMRRVQGDPSDAKEAYTLLSKRAQSNLAARAQRYSAASGKAIAPEAMLVPSRFLLRFEPQRYTAQVAGAYALVEVVGLLPHERAQIPCVFEDGSWHVDLLLPSLPPVQMRPGNSG